MIVNNIADIAGTEREVGTKDWTSKRILLKKDGMGFSMHDTTIRAGAELEMHYKNHLEAVYCIEGEGTLINLDDNSSTYLIAPGILYALNNNDKHILKAKSQMRMVCVFNPPLTGQETHDASGAYPIVEDNNSSQDNIKKKAS